MFQPVRIPATESGVPVNLIKLKITPVNFKSLLSAMFIFSRVGANDSFCKLTANFIHPIDGERKMILV